MNIIMSVKKIKGTKTLKRIKKPYPEIVEVKQMELGVALDYLDKVIPGVSVILVDFWHKRGIIDSYTSSTCLPLPEIGDELEEISFLVLEEYPEWENIQFDINEEYLG